ncbi:MAG TPA: FHA domain-containing protein [Solirubrobacterales bacterium]
MARIWVHKQGEGPVSHPLDDGLIVGRGDHCGLVLDDETVSTDHAQLTRHGTSYLIADLGSRNGTVVNGRLIDKPTRLSPGAVVQVGPFRLELDLPKVIQTKPRRAITVDLTDEERAVARVLVAPYRRGETLAARPATRREIAEELHLSESSVRRRLDSLARKLELTGEARGDRTQMIADRILGEGLDQV